VRVALFVTCIGDTMFPEACRATVEVLERLGHEVVFPAEQTCCGQMHLNSGYPAEADRLARRFREVFAGFDAVVSPSSSCAGTMREHYGLGRVHELSTFLVGELGAEAVGARFPHRVTYHATCHSLRVAHVGDAPYRLLRHVEELEFVALPRSGECCGFGGTFAVNEEAVSCMMGKDRLADHERAGAEIVTGVDMSCLMHLDGLIRRERRPLEVMHVAQLLDRAEAAA
jgi:L-lactate dehydrogenase complex protein LldE